MTAPAMGRGAPPSGRDRGVQPLLRPTLLLTLALAGLAALAEPADAAVPADNTYTGESYITPERFPCPNDFKCVERPVQCHMHICALCSTTR